MERGRRLPPPPADCPIERKYPCCSCWFWRGEYAYRQVIAEARAESSNLLTEEEARRRFPHIFQNGGEYEKTYSAIGALVSKATELLIH